ncbi:MAG: hypothetical protein HC815_40935 [Richelia sp. RM1_1_1]|nr:hypothetical protein [Richelia sp. RM1_1_1]
MTKIIHTIININNCILLVYHTNARCWQFRIISSSGSVFGERKIYYTAQAAEAAGREWVGEKR